MQLYKVNYRGIVFLHAESPDAAADEIEANVQAGYSGWVRADDVEEIKEVTEENEGLFSGAVSKAR